MSRAHVPLLRAGHDLALIVEEMIRGHDVSKEVLDEAISEILGVMLQIKEFTREVRDAHGIVSALRKQVQSWKRSTAALSRKAQLEHPDLQDMAGSCRIVKRRYRAWLASYEASAPDPLFDASHRFTKTHHHPKGEA